MGLFLIMDQVAQARRCLVTGSIPGVRGMEVFLHPFMSRVVLGSTQPPIKSVPGVFLEGKGGRV